MKNKDNIKSSAKEKNYYARIIINKRNRTGLMLAVIVGIIIMAILIYNQIITESSWIILLIPTIIIGALYALIPPTEEWVYLPWQGQAAKQEQTFFR